MAGKLLTIESARGIAAVMVVCAHASGFCQIGGGSAFGGVFGFGTAGVEFFFALSGFIILTVHRGDIGRPERLRRYGWRRLTRIYPLYIVLTVASLGLHFAWPAYRADIDGSAGFLIHNFLMLPYGSAYPAISPAWSLSHEMLFYGVFAVLITSRRIGYMLLAAWMIAVLAARIIGYTPTGGAAFLLVAWVNILFLFGLAAAWIAPRLRHGRVVFLAGTSLLAGCWVAYALGLPVMTAETPRRLALGASSLLMIAGMASWETSTALSVPRWLVSGGAASYSVYLAHYPALEFLSLCRVKLGLVPVLHDETYFVVQIIVGIGAGLAVHRWIEGPMIARLRALDATSIDQYAVLRIWRRSL